MKAGISLNITLPRDTYLAYPESVAKNAFAALGAGKPAAT